MTQALYHICTTADWQHAQTQDCYRPLSLANEGFIHCCFEAQLPDVLARFFAGQHDLLLLEIDTAAVAVLLVLEDLYQHGQNFPHLYGVLPLTAVRSVRALSAGQPLN